FVLSATRKSAASKRSSAVSSARSHVSPRDRTDRPVDEGRPVSDRAIRRLPVDTGASGWFALSARHVPIRSLDGDRTADWLIVGAGFGGLSAARRLSQLRRGEKIVVLDAKEVAEGPAGRNSGFMIDLPHNLTSGRYSPNGLAETKSEIAD